MLFVVNFYRWQGSGYIHLCAPWFFSAVPVPWPLLRDCGLFTSVMLATQLLGTKGNDLGPALYESLHTEQPDINSLLKVLYSQKVL